MMEERETHEIVTPEKGHVVVLKSWVTGREKQKIDASLFKGVQTSGSGDSFTPKLSEDMIANQQNASIEAIVVSVDGATEGVLDMVLDMRVKDFDAVTEAVQAVVDGGLDEKKELSSETNTSESLGAVAETSQIPDGQ